FRIHGEYESTVGGGAELPDAWLGGDARDNLAAGVDCHNAAALLIRRVGYSGERRKRNGRRSRTGGNVGNLMRGGGIDHGNGAAAAIGHKQQAAIWTEGQLMRPGGSRNARRELQALTIEGGNSVAVRCPHQSFAGLPRDSFR